jgi:hypothetical protein
MRFIQLALQRAGFIRTIIETLRRSASVSLTERRRRVDTRRGRERMKATSKVAQRGGEEPLSGPIFVTSGVR